MRSRGFSLLEFLLATALLGSFVVLAQRLSFATSEAIVREVSAVEAALARARLLRFLEKDLIAVAPFQVQDWGPAVYRWEGEAGLCVYFFERPTRRLHRRLGAGSFTERTVLLEGVEEFVLRIGEGEWQVCLRLNGEPRTHWSALPWIVVPNRIRENP